MSLNAALGPSVVMRVLPDTARHGRGPEHVWVSFTGEQGVGSDRVGQSLRDRHRDRHRARHRRPPVGSSLVPRPVRWYHRGPHPRQVSLRLVRRPQQPRQALNRVRLNLGLAPLHRRDPQHRIVQPHRSQETVSEVVPQTVEPSQHLNQERPPTVQVPLLEKMVEVSQPVVN
ncbi:hypothetical protein NOCARDAX2BIS_190027 [Nocardioides sp. AX2bis]|nr:hypothetical protein NOCARDAX2BIS_190027 [Nocardioides sp. AX2bis]